MAMCSFSWDTIASTVYCLNSPEGDDIRMNYRKEKRRQELYTLLGDLPDHTQISARKIDEEEHESYILEKLQLNLNGIEIVPAYFIKPKNAAAPTPAVLFNHSHGGFYHLGKD